MDTSKILILCKPCVDELHAKNAQQPEKLAPTPRPQRKSGLYTVLHAAQQFGFTHPQVGKPRHNLLASSVHLSWPYSISLGLTSNGAA